MNINFYCDAKTSYIFTGGGGGGVFMFDAIVT